MLCIQYDKRSSWVYDYYFFFFSVIQVTTPPLPKKKKERKKFHASIQVQSFVYNVRIVLYRSKSVRAPRGISRCPRSSTRLNNNTKRITRSIFSKKKYNYIISLYQK